MKNSNPNLYIIPGWGEKITRKNYQMIISSVDSKYNIVPIEYTSKKGILFSDIVTQCKNQINKQTSKDTILGFSVGALIAFQLSSKIKFKKSILCSVSALFENDINLYPKSEVDKIFTKAEVDNMKKLKYEKPLSSFVLLHGTLETKELIKRSQKIHQKFGGTLISIANYDHSLNKEYLKQTIRQLLD